MRPSTMLTRLFDAKPKEQRPKREGRKRWSLPLKRHSMSHPSDMRPASISVNSEDLSHVPKIVVDHATPACRLMKMTPPAEDEADSQHEAPTVARFADPISATPELKPVTLHSNKSNTDQATEEAPIVSAETASSAMEVVYVDPKTMKETAQQSKEAEESSMPGEMPSEIPSLELPVCERRAALPPNGTPAPSEDVAALREVFSRHSQTLMYLRSVVCGSEKYVYSVRFREDDFTTTVPLHALKMWKYNSDKVCAALEHAKDATWPHKVLEMVAAIVDEVSTSSASVDTLPDTNEVPDIITSLSKLLSLLELIYSKLMMWLDKHALNDLIGQPKSIPVVPSCELLEIMYQLDHKLKKFTKCIAKDLSFVARNVCQNEVNEWDKILANQALDWEDLSLQLHSHHDQQEDSAEEDVGAPEFVSGPTTTEGTGQDDLPSTIHVSELKANSVDSNHNLEPKKRGVLSRFVRGANTQPQSVTQEGSGVTRLPWSKRGETLRHKPNDMYNPMFGRVSVDV